MRQMTKRGYDFLEQEEGLRLQSYDDATGRPVPIGGPVRGTLTIGWGHTGPDVFKGQTITREQAEVLFDADTDWAEALVEAECPGANDNEYDALVSLVFNIGKPQFMTSTVRRMWKAGKKQAAGEAFRMWTKTTIDGQLVDSPTLIGRRARETAIFFTPASSAVPAPMPQTVKPTNEGMSKTVVAGGVSVAAGAASVADQIDNITPVINSISTVGASFQNVLKLGGLALSIVALCAVAYVLYRYIQKRRRGEVVST